jgi:hypothetical protein
LTGVDKWVILEVRIKLREKKRMPMYDVEPSKPTPDEKMFIIILFGVAAGISLLTHALWGWNFYEMFFGVVGAAAARAALELMGFM